MPSLWSSKANSEWKSRRSKRTPSRKVVSKASLTHSFATITEGADFSAIFSATSRASSSKSSAATTRLTTTFGFFGVHHAPGQAHFHGFGLAGSARQALRAAGARNNAQINFRLAEFCRIGSQNKVAHHRQFAATAQRIAGHRRNNRLSGT